MIDPERNDEPEVVINSMEGKEDMFPQFLTFDFATNTISLAPTKLRDQGRTFYFIITVKERNSNSVKYPFYATVRVEDQGWDEQTIEKYCVDTGLCNAEDVIDKTPNDDGGNDLDIPNDEEDKEDGYEDIEDGMEMDGAPTDEDTTDDGDASVK